MAAIKREYPSITVVGEMFDGEPALVSFFQGGRSAASTESTRGVDTLFDFPALLPAASRVHRAASRSARCRRCSRATTCTRTASRSVTFLGLHDVGRFMNEPGATIDGLKLAFTS